jgi:GrpB-like predicted nucleotidyltransferase (UPF0157 family)
MLGLECDKVVLVPYVSEWTRLFQEEKHRLQKSLGPYVGDIEHIGSTAIPGIVAKPIIDILALLRCVSDMDRCISLLGALGYTYKGEQDVQGWHFFCKAGAANTTHHLHIFPRDNEHWHKYLLFRDYLCVHSIVASTYVALKKRLAAQYADDRKAYTAGKAAFIQSVVALAEGDQLPWTELSSDGRPPMFFPLPSSIQSDCASRR